MRLLTNGDLDRIERIVRAAVEAEKVVHPTARQYEAVGAFVSLVKPSVVLQLIEQVKALKAGKVRAP